MRGMRGAIAKIFKAGATVEYIRRLVISFATLLYCLMAHAGTVTYIYTDPQSTPLAEADAQGAIVATFDYRPYGQIASGSEASKPGYTGQVKDVDTGLNYMQARYYDPVLGRFISRDPIAPSAGDIRSINRFQYANSNPIAYTDPTGKFGEGTLIGCAATAEVGCLPGAAIGFLVDLGVVAVETIAVVVTVHVVTNEEHQPTATDKAKDAVKEGTTAAAGVSGKKGELEGASGGETAAWDKISGKETVYDNGTKVKALDDGGRAELHSSTKSQDYPQGTPTIKIQTSDGKVSQTVRYPKPPPPPPPPESEPQK
jgi:RHS repeat-associated protein